MQDISPSRRPRARMNTYRGVALRLSKQQVFQDDGPGCCSGVFQTRFATKPSGTIRGAALGTKAEKPVWTLGSLCGCGQSSKGQDPRRMVRASIDQKGGRHPRGTLQDDRGRQQPENVWYSGLPVFWFSGSPVLRVDVLSFYKNNESRGTI